MSTSQQKPYLVTFTQTIRFSTKVLASSAEQARAIIQADEVADPRDFAILLDLESSGTSDWAVELIQP